MKPYYEDTEHGITIYHGDCREILPTLPKADCVVTDPPYGINYASNHIGPTTTAAWMNKAIANDQDTSVRDAVLEQFDEWACFGSLRSGAPSRTRGTLVWDKGPASGMGDLTFPWKASYELIFISGRNWYGNRDEGVLSGMWVVTRASMGRTHPNEKPVPVIRYLLNKHTAKSVLDPFMGSGTTLVAAKELGRKAIGIEIEERYCEIAAQRLQQSVFKWPEPKPTDTQMEMAI